MTESNALGFPSQHDVDKFLSHLKEMRDKQRIQDKQGRQSYCAIDADTRLYQARLPSEMHQKFYALLKELDWSRSRGVQYAIYSLLNQKNHE